MSTQLADPTYRGDLGHGLFRRWSQAADWPRVGQLIGSVFTNGPGEPFNERTADVVRILMSETRPSPFTTPGDFALVEDTSKAERPVVACICFWRHEWSYGGIKFGVCQPEMVATDPAYRNRGLVRRLMEMIHARSAAEGHLVQGITGIPYFYRQFDYEYVLDLGGGRIVPLTAVPPKKDDQPEPYHLRLATVTDIAHLLALSNQSRNASLVWHETNEADWRYVIECWDEPLVRERGPVLTGINGHMHMIVDSADTVCGYTWLAAKRWGAELMIYQLQLYSHVNWQTAMPSLQRAFRVHGEGIPPVQRNDKLFSELNFALGRTHPAYEVLDERSVAHIDPPYAWYLRVPDVPAFVRRIAPILEQRLAQSVLVGYTGALKFDFYRGGLFLQFEQGKLSTVEPWRSQQEDDADAGCPPLIFLQLLFGYRSLAELRLIFPDVWANDEPGRLLNILFPKLPSTLFSLDNT